MRYGYQSEGYINGNVCYPVWLWHRPPMWLKGSLTSIMQIDSINPSEARTLDEVYLSPCNCLRMYYVAWNVWAVWVCLIMTTVVPVPLYPQEETRRHFECNVLKHIYQPNYSSTDVHIKYTIIIQIIWTITQQVDWVLHQDGESQNGLLTLLKMTMKMMQQIR